MVDWEKWSPPGIRKAIACADYFRLYTLTVLKTGKQKSCRSKETLLYVAIPGLNGLQIRQFIQTLPDWGTGMCLVFLIEVIRHGLYVEALTYSSHMPI